MLGCTQLQALNFVTAPVSGGARWEWDREWDRLPWAGAHPRSCWCPRGRRSGRGAREVLLCAKGDRTLPGVFGEDAGAALGGMDGSSGAGWEVARALSCAQSNKMVQMVSLVHPPPTPPPPSSHRTFAFLVQGCLPAGGKSSPGSGTLSAVFRKHRGGSAAASSGPGWSWDLLPPPPSTWWANTPGHQRGGIWGSLFWGRGSSLPRAFSLPARGGTGVAAASGKLEG